MLRYILPVRFVMLFACAGALLGAIIMLALAGIKLKHSLDLLWIGGASQGGEVTAAVMAAIDAFLFSIVLMIFAFAIAVGFVLQPCADSRRGVPEWMHVRSIAALKRQLIEVIIVYIVVDFVTDLALTGGGVTWQMLVKPTSVFLLAAALRLMPAEAAPPEPSTKGTTDSANVTAT